jgi:hypothetical protein
MTQNWPLVRFLANRWIGSPSGLERILSHFCGFQGFLEVTPNPRGLIEQTRNGPVARLVAGARAVLPYGGRSRKPRGHHRISDARNRE